MAIRAVFNPPGETSSVSLVIRPDNAQAAFRSGGTVCVSRLNLLDEGLAELCERTRVETGYLGEIHVNAYWSPAGMGLRPHFDARYIMNIQLEGEKRWMYQAQPAVQWPYRNASLSDDVIKYPDGAIDAWEKHGEPVSTDWVHQILAPGDILALPAGCGHAAEAAGESFSLNFHFNPVDVGNLVGKLLTGLSTSEPEWRHAPPLISPSPGDHGLINEHVRFIQNRFREAITQLERYVADRALLVDHLLAAQYSGQQYGVWSTLQDKVSEDVPFSDADSYSLAHPVSVIHHSDHEVTLFNGPDKVTLGGDLATLLVLALSSKRVQIRHAKEVLGKDMEFDNSVLALLNAGMIRVTRDSGSHSPKLPSTSD